MNYRALVDGTVVGTSFLEVRSVGFARGALTQTASCARLVNDRSALHLELADDTGWPLAVTSLRVEPLRSTGELWLLARGEMFHGPMLPILPATSIFEVSVTRCDIEGRFIASVPDLPEACGTGPTARTAMDRVRHSMSRALRERQLRGVRIRRREATMCARLVKLVVERAFRVQANEPRSEYDVVSQALAARIMEATSVEHGERIAREVIDDWLHGYVLVAGACSLGYLGAELARIRALVLKEER